MSLKLYLPIDKFWLEHDLLHDFFLNVLTDVKYKPEKEAKEVTAGK